LRAEGTVSRLHFGSPDPRLAERAVKIYDPFKR